MKQTFYTFFLMLGALSMPTLLSAGTTITYVDVPLSALSGTGTPHTVLRSTPRVYWVTGGGAYCVGGAGIAVGLDNSESGVMYQLKNGATDVGAAVSGTGAAFSFGNQTDAGTYTVVATNAEGSTATMMSRARVSIIPPLSTSLATTNGGCLGASELTLSGASAATEIQWQVDGSTVATIVRAHTTVAGGKGDGSAANQLSSPRGVFVDSYGNIFVADAENHRIQKWAPRASTGTTVAGGNIACSASNASRGGMLAKKTGITLTNSRCNFCLPPVFQTVY